MSIGFDKEYAIWYIRRRTTNGYYCCTVSSRTLQHQLTAASYSGM